MSQLSSGPWILTRLLDCRDTSNPLTFNSGANLLGVVGEVVVGEAVESEEGFIDGILLYVGTEVTQGFNHSPGHVLVEDGVGGEYMDFALLGEVADGVEGGLYGDKGFGFVGAGYDAASLLERTTLG